MAYLPEFEDDIFISYASWDNSSLSEGGKGWIDHFHRALEVLLRQKLGQDPVIWRDIADLHGNDVLADKLTHVLPKVAILVSVLSSGYLKSSWCCREMHEFCAWAERAGNLRIADQLRVFKVLPTHLPLDFHPPEVRLQRGYEFFKMDIVTDQLEEFRPDMSEERARKFYERVGDLAYDIVKLMGVLRSGKVSGQGVSGESGDTIYLAETTTDQQGARDLVRRELLHRGYRILPDRPLPTTEPELLKEINDSMNRCRASVHLVGERYGLVPELARRSVIEIQHDLALQHARVAGFSRFVWLPVGLEAIDERQQRFIAHLETDPSVQVGGELLRTSIEEFKTYLHEKLRVSRPSPTPPAPSLQGGSPRVYVIFDPVDCEAARSVMDHLFSDGLETIEPLGDGDETQVREDHQENLTLCDAALVFWGKAGEAWLRSKLRDFQKAKSYGRTIELQVAVLVAAPESDAKRRFRTHEARTIPHAGGGDSTGLTHWAAELKAARQARPG